LEAIFDISTKNDEWNKNSSQKVGTIFFWTVCWVLKNVEFESSQKEQHTNTPTKMDELEEILLPELWALIIQERFSCG
jgi:nuclear transport factor 2 (NTF2) superfamily protein